MSDEVIRITDDISTDSSSIAASAKAVKSLNDITIKSVNDKTPDENGNLKLDISSVPIGTIIWSASNITPEGFLLCDGGEYNIIE